MGINRTTNNGTERSISVRGLAWYTGILCVVGSVYMFTQVLTGVEIADNVWGIVLNAPVIVFAILYLKGGKDV